MSGRWTSGRSSPSDTASACPSSCGIACAVDREPVDRVFYLKAYPTVEEAECAHAHLEALATHSAETRAAVHVDRPIALVRPVSAMLLDAASGRPLADVQAAGTLTE